MKYIFFLLISVLTSAQSDFFIIEGIVLDNKKSPIPNANVVIYDNSYEYTVHTGGDGKFNKKIYNVKDKVSIRITAYNYEEIKQEIIPNKEKYIFYMSPKYREIDEIVIKKGITHKGDSTIYDADFYANKKENKVIDLLKKLPNVDVNRAGKISINGKEIDRVLVENETFFTGSSALAINSLPANSVEQFEFIENFNNNAILGGSSDKIVLNISLKEEKKKLIFGDINLNGNSWSRYDVGGNLFYYAPKTKVNVISNINNINKSVFTIEDYMSFNGGTDRLLRDPMAFISNFNSKNLLELINPNEKHEKSQIFNAINISQNIFNNKFKLSIFNINNNNESRELKENSIKFNDKKLSFFERNENIDYNTTDRNNTLNFTLSNINNEKIDFQYYFSFKNLETIAKQNKNIILSNRDDIYKSERKYQNDYINQVIDVSYRLSERHSQGWLVNIISSNNKENVSSYSDKKMYFHSIFNLKEEENRILQDELNKNNNIKINFQHKYNFLTHHQIGFNANILYKKQNISNKFDINGRSYIISNRLSLDSKNINIGLEYLFKNRNFNISIIGDLLDINSLFESDKNSINVRLQHIIPRIKFEYTNKRIGTFNINYKRDLKDIPVHYYYLGNFFKSSNHIFVGIAEPKNPLIENFSISYNKKSGYYGGYSIYFQYDFSNDLKGYINNTTTTSIEKTNSINYRDNIGNRQEFELRLEKQFLRKKISIISQNSISYETQNLNINGNNDISKYDTRSFNLIVKSRFKGNYNFEIYNKYEVIDYKNTFSKNLYRQNEIGVMLNFNPMDKWEIATDITFNKDLVNNLSYNKSTIKIGYFINSNINFNLFMNNVFGAYRKTTLNTDEYLSYYQREKLMNRFLNIGLTYKF